MGKTFLYSLEGQETERILFRPIVATDFDTWLEFCRFPKSLDYIYSQEQLAVEDPVERCKMWFERVFNRYEKGLGGMNALIDKNTGAFVGQCGLLIQTIDDLQELEIGYSLMPQHRGKGYASEAARKCKEFAFTNNFRDSLISTIHIDNDASAQVAMANGMRLDKTTVSNGDPVNIYRIWKKDYDKTIG
jgi:RimJ/RimL family protein N-acetyltransferase